MDKKKIEDKNKLEAGQTREEGGGRRTGNRDSWRNVLEGREEGEHGENIQRGRARN